jgi:hypothetical protein
LGTRPRPSHLETSSTCMNPLTRDIGLLDDRADQTVVPAADERTSPLVGSKAALLLRERE